MSRGSNEEGENVSGDFQFFEQEATNYPIRYNAKGGEGHLTRQCSSEESFAREVTEKETYNNESRREYIDRRLDSGPRALDKHLSNKESDY